MLLHYTITELLTDTDAELERALIHTCDFDPFIDCEGCQYDEWSIRLDHTLDLEDIDNA